MREIAAQEITEALKRNGNFKIIFVVTVEAGRVHPDDVTTINTVLESIKTKVYYGIIVNKVSKRFITEVEKNKEDVFKILFTGFNSGLHRTDYIYYFERVGELDDQDNKIAVLPNTLKDYIYQEVPFNLILQSDVKKIELNQFEYLKKAFETQLKNLKEDAKLREQAFQETIQNLEKKRDEIQKQYHEQLERFQNEQKRLLEKLENERLENQKKMQEQQKNFQEQMSKANEEQKRILQEQNERFQEKMNDANQSSKIQQQNLLKEIEYLKNRPVPCPPRRGTCSIL